MLTTISMETSSTMTPETVDVINACSSIQARTVVVGGDFAISLKTVFNSLSIETKLSYIR